MVAVIIALFFACAASFAVLTICRSLAGSVERMDAVFAEYAALGGGSATQDHRFADGQMLPPVRYVPAPAPDFAPRRVFALPVRDPRVARFNQDDWCAAA